VKGKQVGYVLIAVIVLGLAGIVARLLSADADLPLLSGINALSPDTIDKVVLRDWESEVIVEKESDGSWWVEDYPATLLQLDDFWDAAQRFDGAELIATKRSSHATMGVSPEFGTVVQLWRGEDLVDQFIVGDKQFVGKSEEEAFFLWSVYARKCYLRHRDSDEVYAIYCEVPDKFSTRLNRWKYSLIADMPSSDIEAFTFTYPDDQFDIRLLDSVWVVQTGDVAQQAVQEEVHGILRQLDRGLGTTRFPTAEEVEGLDWSRPDILVGVGTKPGASTSSLLLLFLRKDGEGAQGGFYVKGAENSWVHFLDDQDVEPLLKSRGVLLGAPPPAADSGP